MLDSRIRQDFARRLGNHVGDVLAEFLDLARQYERVNPPSLLGFIEDVEKTKAEISRESESRGRDEIRIMTIHGAKGLEAPVVILPDALRKKPKPPGSRRFSMMIACGAAVGAVPHPSLPPPPVMPDK